KVERENPRTIHQIDSLLVRDHTGNQVIASMAQFIRPPDCSRLQIVGGDIFPAADKNHFPAPYVANNKRALPSPSGLGKPSFLAPEQMTIDHTEGSNLRLKSMPRARHFVFVREDYRIVSNGWRMTHAVPTVEIDLRDFPIQVPTVIQSKQAQ